MPDMLVKLYELPDLHETLCRTKGIGIETRRPNPWDKSILLKWVERTFSSAWALECETAFATNPPSCYIAVEKETLIGFACYHCTRKNFFGPTGVAEPARGKGAGRALLLASLHAMRDEGYAYAVIGGVGPAEYYVKTVGATLIAGSSPGIYDFSLRRKAQAPERHS
jgi:GNAT superfamily N-acetyltransferase